ncbi:Uncharacterised protein [Neisseria dentiae]|nr:Uncharacterised protein [Neisseria dentiae]
MHLHHRPQRRGQNHPAQSHHGAGGRQSRTTFLRRHRPAQTAPRKTPLSGHRLCAAGAADIFPTQRGRQPQNQPAGLPQTHGRAQRRRARDDLRAVSRALRHETAARRRPLRRPAATARHRPRADTQPQPADSRRTHRRHPAQYRRRHHPRDPPPQSRMGG